MRRFLVALLLVLPIAAAAQEPNPPDDSIRFRSEVVVTPERTETPRALVPAATAVLPAATILTLPAVTFGNIASFLPGFSVAQAEFHAGRPVLSARGFFGGGEADYVLLLVDGVPVTDAESGLIDCRPWPPRQFALLKRPVVRVRRCTAIPRSAVCCRCSRIEVPVFERTSQAVRTARSCPTPPPVAVSAVSALMRPAPHGGRLGSRTMHPLSPRVALGWRPHNAPPPLGVALVPTNSLYREARFNLLGLAVNRHFRFGQTSIRPRFEIGNALNANTVTTINPTYGSTWQAVRGVITPRTAKVALQMDF